MPTRGEMNEALESIRSFCRSYSGKHQGVFAELYLRIRPLDLQGDDERVRREDALSAQYADAISTLLSLADRPSGITLRSTLQVLADIAEVDQLSDVHVVDEKNEVGYFLSESLAAKPRRISRAKRAVLDEFRQNLPKDSWGSAVDDNDGRG